MPPSTKPVVPRKRNRKRKRRAASESSSSSSSSSSSASDDDTPAVRTTVNKSRAQEVPSAESSSSSSSSSGSDSEPESEANLSKNVPTKLSHISAPKTQPTHRASPSPSPPPSKIPSFLSGQDHSGLESAEQESLMKEKFRKFWMESVADGFKGDLEEIRKEPNLGPSRLALLIDSLASGADVFTSAHGDGSINEMEVILE